MVPNSVGQIPQWICYNEDHIFRELRPRREDFMSKSYKSWVLGLLVLASLALAACGGGGGELTKNADGYVDLRAAQLADLLQEQDTVLVNVHIPYEGELPDTDLFIPFDDMQANLGQLPDKDANIVLYCRSGSMSTSAAEELVDLGYSNVYELDGGFNAWKAAGYELITDPLGTTKVHCT